jgi:histidinol dehydrogenase
MRVEAIEWRDAARAATAIRDSVARLSPPPDVREIAAQVAGEGDQALRKLTARFDATERSPDSLALRVDPEEIAAALAGLDPGLRTSLELARANIRAVAEAQLDREPRTVPLPEGQTVSIRDLAVGAVGIYAPGGRAAYPSSVLMCAVPAAVAGVDRIALATPPGPDGRVASPVLAAAALCEIAEVYAIGGAQAIFALAHGSETVAPVDVIAGPGNAWVREAKRTVSGAVGIDSLAGPSELMLIAGRDTDPDWAALDLCAQAEHGEGGVLVAASTDGTVLSAIGSRAAELGERPGIDPGAQLSTIEAPSVEDAVDLANALAPEHLELLDAEAMRLADRVTTAGCVFAGPHSATAFGDYVAGSNHVLPTGGAGRFSGPLGPNVFRRKIATVEVPPEAAAKLAPHVETIARAEGFPVHGESAMIRAKHGDRSER